MTPHLSPTHCSTHPRETPHPVQLQTTQGRLETATAPCPIGRKQALGLWLTRRGCGSGSSHIQLQQGSIQFKITARAREDPGRARLGGLSGSALYPHPASQACRTSTKDQGCRLPVLWPWATGMHRMRGAEKGLLAPAALQQTGHQVGGQGLLAPPSGLGGEGKGRECRAGGKRDK